jgi:ferredoxin
VTLSKADIRRQAHHEGIDLIGFARWSDLEDEAPPYDKPSSHSSHLTTLVVLVKRTLVGVTTARDAAARQYASGRIAQMLEEAAAKLAYWLEERDVMAAVLSAMIPDLRRQPLDYCCPAGQGSLLLRQAAVRAGLGSLGLNMMLLTPQFGPRLFVSGVLTDLDFEPDLPFSDELCPGLEECGRCAAVCPERAIPSRAPAGTALAEVRDLDAGACARSSQPYGPGRMVEHLEQIFTAPTAEDAQAIARGSDSLQLFHNLTLLKHGAFTGCSSCELVCPVGDDYPAVEASPVCRDALPDGVEHHLSDGVVMVSTVGDR